MKRRKTLKNPFDILPLEILCVEILPHLDLLNISYVSLVSKKINKICSCPLLWKVLSVDHYGKDRLDEIKVLTIHERNENNWKSLFLKLRRLSFVDLEAEISTSFKNIIHKNDNVYDVLKHKNTLKRLVPKTIFFLDGSLYQGDVIDGSPNGFGILTKHGCFKGSYHTNVYEGYFLDAETMKGNGTITSFTGNSELKYVGEIKGMLMHGKGKLVKNCNTIIYEGDFYNGEYHGMGVRRYSDGTIYKGSFLRGKRAKNGVMLYPDGCRIIGWFVDNELLGKQTLVLKDGTKISGRMNDCNFQGGINITFPNSEENTINLIESHFKDVKALIELEKKKEN